MAEDIRDKAIHHATGPSPIRPSDLIMALGDTWPVRAAKDLYNSADQAVRASTSTGSAWLPSDVPDVTDEVVRNTTGFTGDAARSGIVRAMLERPTDGVQIGIFAGPRAKNAPIDALHDAFRMKQHNMHPDEIWRRTGWGELPDKNWMWEISDDLYKLNPNPTNDTKIASRAVEHPGLFGAYPDIGNTSVGRTAKPGTGYSIAPQGDFRGAVNVAPEVNVPPSWTLVDVGTNLNSPESVLLHELQHQIQSKEGWVPGTSSQITQSRMRQVLEEVGSSIPRSQMESAISDPLLIHRLYERDLGEQMARATQERQWMTPLERREFPPWLNMDFSKSIIPRY